MKDVRLSFVWSNWHVGKRWIHCRISSVPLKMADVNELSRFMSAHVALQRKHHHSFVFQFPTKFFFVQRLPSYSTELLRQLREHLHHDEEVSFFALTTKLCDTLPCFSHEQPLVSIVGHEYMPERICISWCPRYLGFFH